MIVLQGLPFPTSMNSHYMPSRGRLILSPGARLFKRELELDLSLNHELMIGKAKSLKGRPLVVFMSYIGSRQDWFTQDGRIRKVDIDSLHKSFIDVVFKFLGLEDSQIFLHKTSKNTVKDCKERHVEISIGEFCGQNFN